jgi:hypothetical protein
MTSAIRWVWQRLSCFSAAKNRCLPYALDPDLPSKYEIVGGAEAVVDGLGHLAVVGHPKLLPTAGGIDGVAPGGIDISLVSIIPATPGPGLMPMRRRKVLPV